MRTALVFGLSVLWLSVISASVSAQDSLMDPEAGDVAGEEVAPSNEPEADASAAPQEEAPAADDGKKAISVALLLGYGVSLEDGGNPWGFGFGARGGYNLDQVYLGARFVFYLGESVTVPNLLGGAASETSVNIWELGVEVGYDVDLSKGLTLRPELGLGIANSSTSFNGFSTSSTDLFLAPGASLLFDVAEDIFLGVDVRFQFILASATIKGIPLLATGGMRF